MGGETIYHNCSFCADRFSLSVALLMHKIQCHSWDSNGKSVSFDTFSAELIKEETKHSSDATFDYTINITTSVTRTGKECIVKAEPLTEIITDDNMDISESIKLEHTLGLPSQIILDPKNTLCRFCSVEISKKSIRRHVRTWHTNEIDPESEASNRDTLGKRSSKISNEAELIFEEIDIKDPLLPVHFRLSPDENPTNVDYDEIDQRSMDIQSYEQFRQASKIQKNRNRRISNKKLGICPVCGTSMFARSVARHLRIKHTANILPAKGPRTYKPNAFQEMCPICHRVGFIRNLKRHLIQVHQFTETQMSDVNLRESFKCLKCSEVHPRSELKGHFMKFHNISSSSKIRRLHVTAGLPETNNPIHQPDIFVLPDVLSDSEASSERSPSPEQLKRFKPKCPICKKRIVEMRRHLQVIHELNGSDLRANLSLANYRSETNDIISKCSFCDYNGTIVALRLHNLLSHSVECGTSLTKLYDPNPIPLIYRQGKRGYNCTLCQYDETKRPSMLDHLLSEHLETINQLTGVTFDCDICTNVFTSFNDYEAHQNKHIHKFKNAQFFCDYCGVSKRSKSVLTDHILAHLNLRNLICDICHKGFNTKHTIATHMLSHISDKPYQCKVYGCTAKYGRTEKLRTHMKIRHSTTHSPYQCEICGKFFKLKRYLKLHVFTHSGVPQEFKCKTCHSIFPSRQRLKKHRANNC